MCSPNRDIPTELSCTHWRCWGLLELRVSLGAGNRERPGSLTHSKKPLVDLFAFF